jgi:hypothetical protein
MIRSTDQWQDDGAGHTKGYLIWLDLDDNLYAMRTTGLDDEFIVFKNPVQPKERSVRLAKLPSLW